ncbi:MAG: NAD-dependent epimerase/dehydratase family protein [Acidobacteriota bacterium]
MKVLVIGGSGYIGSHTVEELLRRGYEVCILVRGITTHQLPTNTRIIKGDRHSPDDLIRLRAEHFDAIIDINAYTREATQLIIKTFDGFISRFVHLSTLAVCQRSSIPVTEDDAMVTNPNAGYAYDKAECERALRWAYAKSRFPYVCIRPSAVYGERDRLSRENYYLKRMISDDAIIVPDSGAVPIWAVYVKDLAKVLANAVSAKNVEGRCYNLSQPEVVTINQHIANIARLIQTPVKILHIPSRLLERLGFNLAHFPYALPNDELILIDTRAVRADLQFAATPYAQALRDTIEWFLERGVDSEPSIEEAFPPVIPRSRERVLVERYHKATQELEDRLTDEWLNEALPEL